MISTPRAYESTDCATDKYPNSRTRARKDAADPPTDPGTNNYPGTSARYDDGRFDDGVTSLKYGWGSLWDVVP